MMFAQQSLENVPAGFWKNFCIGLLVLLGAAATLVAIWSSMRRPEPARLNDDPPIKVEKISKRYNHDAIDQRFGRIETRIDGHDSELDAAWKEMQRMNEQNNKTNLEVAVSLARLETHFGLDRHAEKNK